MSHELLTCPSDIATVNGRPLWMNVPSAEAPAFAGMTGGVRDEELSGVDFG